MMPCRLRLLIAAAVSAIFIAPACAFAPLSGGLRLVSQAANVRVAPRAVQRARAGALSLRASVDGQEGAPQPQVPGDELLTPEELAAKYPPLRKGETREEDGMVQITEEELLELASKAGVKVKLVRGGPGRRDQEYLPPGERRVLKPLFEKLEPIFALPVYLQYPILLALAGGLAAFFIPLFGTGSLRDIKGAPPPGTASPPPPVLLCSSKTSLPRERARAPAPPCGLPGSDRIGAWGRAEAVEVKEAKPAAGLKLPEMPAADVAPRPPHSRCTAGGLRVVIACKPLQDRAVCPRPPAHASGLSGAAGRRAGPKHCQVVQHVPDEHDADVHGPGHYEQRHPQEPRQVQELEAGPGGPRRQSPRGQGQGRAHGEQGGRAGGGPGGGGGGPGGGVSGEACCGQ